ncbi:flagellar hook-length control protein FliK [Selenihalanaerobacter shriftii]|uniref:Hook-length control protein FliK n=1 Tax=Selenihalanaerobacter shriftii TaxID=142842 RepID=A0A1T4MAY5_9FIRM|nr:flagellar hook-length control protein FliK [Selenihalanaerobacter shriftii]SJZ64210.1 hook-length control protein FliK [Selenihalanaerobacter shriftii]
MLQASFIQSNNILEASNRKNNTFENNDYTIDGSKDKVSNELFLTKLKQVVAGKNKNSNNKSISKELPGNKITDESINLNLKKEEIEKLKKFLTQSGFDLSTTEIEELLASIGDMYQQLVNLEVNEVSFESTTNYNKFEAIKTKLSNLIKNFGDIKETNSLASQHKQTKSQISDLMSKLVDLKEILNNLDKEKLDQILKTNSKLSNNFKETSQKLSKLLQKHGITKEQIKFTKQKKHDGKILFKNKENIAKEQNAKGNSSSSSNKKLKAQVSNKTSTTNTNKTSTNIQFNDPQQASTSQNIKSNQQFKNQTVDFNQNLVPKDSSEFKLGKEGLNLKMKIDSELESSNDNRVNIEEQIGIKSSKLNRMSMSTNNDMVNRVDQTKIINQINEQLEQLKSLGKNELTLKLEPEFLGKLNLKMAMEDGIMTTKLMAENYQVKKIIEAQLPRLRNELSAKNIELGEVVVDVGTEDDFSNSQNSNYFNERNFSKGNNGNQQKVDSELIDEVEIKELNSSSLINSHIGSDSIDYVI